MWAKCVCGHWHQGRCWGRGGACTCTIYQLDDDTDGEQSRKGLDQTTFAYTGFYKRTYEDYAAPNDDYYF